MAWNFIGQGSYNMVYRHDTNGLVFKVQKCQLDSTDQYDTPSRLTELMKELYPEFAAKIEIITVPKLGIGWTFPFIEGTHPTDEEMFGAIIDIFNRTGRVLLDGCMFHNFLKTSSTHPLYPNRIFCIDIGMLVNVRKEEIDGAGGRMRRKSETSLSLLIREEPLIYYDLWSHSRFKSLPSTRLIKALILISTYRPLINNVDFLKANDGLVTTLSALYEKNFTHSPQRFREDDATWERRKRALKTEIEDYLKSAIDPLVTPTTSLVAAGAGAAAAATPVVATPAVATPAVASNPPPGAEAAIGESGELPLRREVERSLKATDSALAASDPAISTPAMAMSAALAPASPTPARTVQALKSLRFFTPSTPYLNADSSNNLSSLKKNCCDRLNAYIKTRGTIDTKTNAFKPSFITYWFRNHSLTQFKIKETQSILTAIDKANSLDELKSIMQRAKADKRLGQSSFQSGLKGGLTRCERLIDEFVRAGTILNL